MEIHTSFLNLTFDFTIPIFETIIWNYILYSAMFSLLQCSNVDWLPSQSEKIATPFPGTMVHISTWKTIQHQYNAKSSKHPPPEDYS